MKQWLIIECMYDRYNLKYIKRPLLVTDNEEKMKFLSKGNDVYEINKNGTMTLIKSCCTDNEEGMALYYWDININGPFIDEIKPKVLFKFPNITPFDSIPEEVKEYLERSYEKYNELTHEGYFSCYTFIDREEVYMIYGKYWNDEYYIPY